MSKPNSLCATDKANNRSFRKPCRFAVLKRRFSLYYIAQAQRVLGRKNHGLSCDAMFFGILIGLLAGYYKGVFDILAMCFIDILMAFPYVLLAIAIIAALGPELFCSRCGHRQE